LGCAGIAASTKTMIDSDFLAQTLEYLNLTFCCSDIVSFNQEVFETETHPRRIWEQEQAFESNHTSTFVDRSIVSFMNSSLLFAFFPRQPMMH
jgi:hypothetical protein